MTSKVEQPQEDGRNSELKDKIGWLVKDAREKEKDAGTVIKADEEDIYRDIYTKSFLRGQRRKELNLEQNFEARKKLADVIVGSLQPDKPKEVVIKDEPLREFVEAGETKHREFPEPDRSNYQLSKGLSKPPFPKTTTSFVPPDLAAKDSAVSTRERVVGDFRVKEQVVDGTTINEIFEKTKIGFLLSERELVTIQHNCTISEALYILSENGISSAPVLKKKVVIGMIDVFDLVAAVVSLLDKHPKSADRLFQKNKVKHYMNFSGLNPWTPVSMYDNIKSVLLGMGLGLHRAAICDIHGGLVGLVSQTDVVQLFAEYKQLLGSRLNYTLSELNWFLPEKDILALSSTRTALDALRALIDNKVSAVAIVNEKEELVGEVSVSHFKAITFTTFHYLLYPCSLFIERTQMVLSRIKVNTKLHDVVDQFMRDKTHRLWVFDPTNTKLVGLLTMTQFLRLLLQYEPAPPTHVLEVTKVV